MTIIFNSNSPLEIHLRECWMNTHISMFMYLFKIDLYLIYVREISSGICFFHHSHVVCVHEHLLLHLINILLKRDVASMATPGVAAMGPWLGSGISAEPSTHRKKLYTANCTFITLCVCLCVLLCLCVLVWLWFHRSAVRSRHSQCCGLHV